MREQFNLSRKQQQVKAELSKPSDATFLKILDGNKRNALRNLQSQIEKHIPLCPENWRHELHKISFLRDALATESRAEHISSGIDGSTKWRGLCTDLGNALQLCIERDGDVAKTPIGTSTKTLKPSIYFAAPKYSRKITKTLFLG